MLIASRRVLLIALLSVVFVGGFAIALAADGPHRNVERRVLVLTAAVVVPLLLAALSWARRPLQRGER